MNYNNMWRLADRFFRIAAEDGYGDAWMRMLCERDADSVEAVINAAYCKGMALGWPLGKSHSEGEKIAQCIFRAVAWPEEEDKLIGKNAAVERLQKALKERPARKVKP